MLNQNLGEKNLISEKERAQLLREQKTTGAVVCETVPLNQGATILTGNEKVVEKTFEAEPAVIKHQEKTLVE